MFIVLYCSLNDIRYVINVTKYILNKLLLLLSILDQQFNLYLSKNSKI